MEIDEIDDNEGHDEHIYCLKKIDEIQEILIAERDKRNKLSTKFNRGVNIIGVIDNCLGVTAIELGITGVGLLSTIGAASAVIRMETISIVMGLLRVVGNQAIKKMLLKREKHEKIAMLAVSSLNTISNLISKALSDGSISDEEYSLILLELETFTRLKEDLTEKSKTSLENTGNIKLKIMNCFEEIRLVFRLEHMFEAMFETIFKTMFKKPCSKPCSKPYSKNIKYN